MLSHKVNYLPVICDCEYHSQFPTNRGIMDGNLYDTSAVEYFPAVNVCYPIKVPKKDRFDIYLNVEDYLPDHIRVRVVDDFVVIKGRNKKREAGGWVEKQFSRRYPLPSGFKLESLISNYLPEGILNITAALVKCEEFKMVEKTKDPADKIPDGLGKAETDNLKGLTCALEAENALYQTVKDFEKTLVLTD